MVKLEEKNVLQNKVWVYVERIVDDFFTVA